MKKTYMQPATEWFEVNGQAMIAESFKVGLDNGSLLGDEKPTDDDENNIYVKGMSVFDIEW